MSARNLTTQTMGRILTTPLALIMASAVIWTLAAGSSTVGQQASQSTAAATQNSASQADVANMAEIARDSNAKVEVREHKAEEWSKDLNAAKVKAQKLNRPLLISTNVSWSGPDKQQMEKILSDSAIAAAIDASFVKVLVSDSGEPIKTLKVEKFPTIIFCAPDMTELLRREGLNTRKEMRDLLTRAAANFERWSKDRAASASQTPAANSAGEPATPTRPARFIHYISHGQRAMPVFTSLMKELWKKDVVLSVGHPGEPPADQLRLEVTVAESSDWEDPVVELLKEVADLPVRPIALSCGPSQDKVKEVTDITFRWGPDSPASDVNAVRTVLKRQSRVMVALLGPVIDSDASGKSAKGAIPPDQVANAPAENAPPPKLLVTGDGGTKGEQDRERLRKLVQEGIVVQQDPAAAPAPAGASLMFQPRLPANQLTGMGGGYFGGPASSGVDPAAPEKPAEINQAWDSVVRKLHSALHSRNRSETLANNISIRLSHVPFMADVDAVFTLPEASPDELAELVLEAFREAGLAVSVQRQHPVFSATTWIKGKETFALYANESGSPASVLGANDLVDVRFVDADYARLSGLLSSLILEKQRVELLESQPRKASGLDRRILGLNLSTDEANLLRTAERFGRLEAVRRDPRDTADHLSSDQREHLRGVLREWTTPRPPVAIPGSEVPASSERQITFGFREAPWTDVLEAIATSANLPLDVQSTPEGTFSYVDSNPHTLSDAISLLNRQLMDRGHLLIERGRTLVCFNFQTSPISADAISDVKLEDLSSRKDYELLSVTFPVSGADLSQVAKDILQFKGPLGSVATLPSLSSIRVTDLASNLRRVAKVVRDVRADTSPSPAQLQVKHFRLQNSQAGSLSSLLAQVVRKNGFSAVADERTNSIVVTSPDEETSLLAEALLAKLDEQIRARDESDPLASRVRSVSGQPAKPLPELQKAYAEREAAAAAVAAELRKLTESTSGKQAVDPKETALRGKLTAAVKESFAARQEMLREELDALKSKIVATQQSLELRNKASDQIVARRVEDLLNPDLKWDDAGTVATTDSTSPLASQSKSSFARSGTAPPPGASSFSSPQSRATGSGGGQFGPARGFNPLSGAPKSPMVESTASFGRSSATDPNPFAVQANRKPRALVVEGVDHLQIRAMIQDLGLSPKTSVDGMRVVDVRFEATDDEYQKIRTLMEGAAAEVRKQKQDAEQAQRLSLLTGIWDPVPSSFDPTAGVPPKLVIHKGFAATFEGNERKRLWRLETDKEGEYTFSAQDGQKSMQGTYDSGTHHLALVSVGKAGAQIDHYSRTIAAVPPEWVAEMEKAVAKVPAKPSFKEIPPRADDKPVSMGSTLTRPRPQPHAGTGRNPSDYLELLRHYQQYFIEYYTLRETVGDNHPQVKKFLRDRTHELEAIDVLRQEFQAELEAAAAQLNVKEAELAAARDSLARANQLQKQQVISQAEVQKEEHELTAAQAQLRAAESRFKLFELTRDKVFPPDLPKPAPAPSKPAVARPAEPSTIPPPSIQSPAQPSPPQAVPAKPPTPPQAATESAPPTTLPVPAAVAPVAPQNPDAPAANPAPPAAPVDVKTPEPTSGPAVAPVEVPTPEVAPGPVSAAP